MLEMFKIEKKREAVAWMSGKTLPPLPVQAWAKDKKATPAKTGSKFHVFTSQPPTHTHTRSLLGFGSGACASYIFMCFFFIHLFFFLVTSCISNMPNNIIHQPTANHSPTQTDRQEKDKKVKIAPTFSDNFARFPHQNFLHQALIN